MSLLSVKQECLTRVSSKSSPDLPSETVSMKCETGCLECVARVPVSLGGLGVRLCSPSFAFAFATVRNRSAVRLSTVASASGVVPKACQGESLSPQFYWCLQRRCLCE